MTKSNVMEHHSTEIESARLSPNAVLRAALEDFKRVERNKLRQAGEIQALDFEHFAFHRRHVHKAKTPMQLIELALRFQSAGLESGKKNTRLIYRDRPVLQGAYELAGGHQVVGLEEPKNTEK